MPHDPKQHITIRYETYPGETASRQVIPIRIRFAASEGHHQQQWLMDAYDLTRKTEISVLLADALEGILMREGVFAHAPPPRAPL
jgi:hypothetical protein